MQNVKFLGRLPSIAGLLVLVTTDLVAIERPWADDRLTVTPWGHAERTEKREGWFQSLNLGAAFKQRISESQPWLSRKPAPTNSAVPSLPTEAINPNQNLMAFKEPTVDDPLDVPDTADLSELPWKSFEDTLRNPQMKGRLVWPVEGGHISSGYGFRSGRVHEGIDIAATYGNSIRAVADGRIVYTGVVAGYGKIVVVYHGGGISTIYAHNSQNLKARGDNVRQGETLARVGKSGEATGAHCHFEVRENGKPTNPLRYTYMQSPLFAQK